MSTYTEYHKKYYESKKKVNDVKDIKTFQQGLFWTARTRARNGNIPFEITIEDIIIPTHCKYLNVELTTIRGNGKIDTNASLDRIDSTKGYIPNNIEVISLLANRMKNSATIEQLKTFAKNIDKIYG